MHKGVCVEMGSGMLYTLSLALVTTYMLCEKARTCYHFRNLRDCCQNPKSFIQFSDSEAKSGLSYAAAGDIMYLIALV